MLNFNLLFLESVAWFRLPDQPADLKRVTWQLTFEFDTGSKTLFSRLAESFIQQAARLRERTLPDLKKIVVVRVGPNQAEEAYN